MTHLMRKAVVRTLALSAGILAVTFGIAQAAGTDHYCRGIRVGPGYACSGSLVHSNSGYYVEVTSDHTACASGSSVPGSNGFAYLDYSNIYRVACTNGAGTNGGSFGVANQFKYGAVANPNGSTVDTIQDAHATG